VNGAECFDSHVEREHLLMLIRVGNAKISQLLFYSSMTN
jgi:hypothetical protein